MSKEIVLVTSTVDWKDQGKGLIAEGTRPASILAAALGQVGLSRQDVQVIHTDAVEWLADGGAKVLMPLDSVALKTVTGIDGSIQDWRGSGFHLGELLESGFQEEFLNRAGGSPAKGLHGEQWIVPTLHPSAIESQFTWHPLLTMDLRRARGLARNDPAYTTRRKRSWFFNDLPAFQRMVEGLKVPTSHSGIIAFDTESWPYYIVGIVTEDEVHVFEWQEKFRSAAQELFASPFVIKVAHNLQHDVSFLLKKLDIMVSGPWFDTMGGANVLNNALGKALSPDISTRYTNWPHHKWLVDHDPLLYNGMDNVVTYDAYEPMLKELFDRDLYKVAVHDHALLAPLLDMQWHGVKIDKNAHAEAIRELRTDREGLVATIQEAVRPVTDANLGRFKKPHLFERERSCECCGGGKLARSHCWRCGGLAAKPEKKADYCPINPHLTSPEDAMLGQGICMKVSMAEHKANLPMCRTCQGTGKVKNRLVFNPDSSDAVADVLYRGLGIKPRKYKGNETVRVGSIEPLAEEYPLVAQFVRYAKTNAELETVERLTGGPDGRSHSVFDPFGTGVGRVAAREGLVEIGTNLMNVPKKARRLVVPDRDDMVFLYPDQKQIEARAIAVLSKDRNLIEIFNSGTDLHALVRDDMRKIGFAAFSRDQAKRLEYATSYGGKAKQVAKELSDEAFRKGEGEQMSEAKTQLAMDSLLANRFQGVGNWQRGVERELLATRKIRSVTGRERVWLEYLYDRRTKGVNSEILKQAYAFGPQDIGGWILGLGMLDAWESGKWESVRGLIHVHDALLFQTASANVEEASALVREWLTQEQWGMKFEIDVKVGKNWLEAS